MTSIYILIMAANFSLGVNNTMMRDIPFRAYVDYTRCNQAAKFYTTEEKNTGISYYCVEMEIRK